MKKRIAVLLVAFTFVSAAFFMPKNIKATTHKGIDIFSGNDISDYSTIKAQGIDVVIAKATQGVDYVDSSFIYRCNHVRQVGLKFGTYHFAGGLYGHTPEEEAQNFINIIKGQTFDTCLFLDIEDYKTRYVTKTWSKQEAINFVNAFINYIQARGYRIGVYCCQSFYYEKLKGNIPNVPIWLANYSQEPAQFPNAVSWQYSQTGNLNAASGDLDMDYFNDSIFTGRIPQQANNSTSNVTTQSSQDIATLQAELNRQGYGDLNVDNIAGRRTLAACPTVHNGSRGNITRWVQQKLGVTADGINGRQTQNAIKTFQRLHGLYADGIVGKNTWRALLGL